MNAEIRVQFDSIFNLLLIEKKCMCYVNGSRKMKSSCNLLKIVYSGTYIILI